MKEPMEHSAFPSDETLAAFIDGGLDEETRKKVVAHVAECEDCYGTIMAAGAWRREESPRTVKPLSFARPRNRYYDGLAAAAAIGGVLILYSPVHARFAQWRDTAALREGANVLPQRAASARVSLDLEYKPQPQNYRGGNETGPEHWKVEAAAARLQRDAERDSRIVAQHSMGIGLLLEGEYEKAAETLDAVIERETSTATLTEAINKSNDVALLIDVSAAHSAWADAIGSAPAASRPIALAAAERAFQIDPKSPRVVWNRAVALEGIDRKRAIQAWKGYIATDPASKWTEEAKGRVQYLEEETQLDSLSVPQPDGLGVRR
jgi:putative zinc finger protein